MHQFELKSRAVSARTGAARPGSVKTCELANTLPSLGDMIPQMKQLVALEYQKARPPWSGAVIAALTVGLCSGPVIWGIICFQDLGYAVEIVGDLITFVCGFVSIVFCAFVYMRLERPGSRRGRSLAMA